MLNERQQQSIELTEGTVRVVAGAGSGKTSVLAHRYAYLVNDLGISPGNILCMTFTNKAAQEMRRRIAKMVERGNVNDFICTIHGFCAKFLRREIYRIGMPKNFLILDQEDAKSLARQAMQEYGVDRRKTTAERFLQNIGKIKGADSEGYIFRRFMPDASMSAESPEERYMQLQMRGFALDYDDLQYITIFILRHFKEAREYWLDKLNYIMVDESQDCSSDDWQLIRILAEGHGNLFMVGDPDQAIYEWRGASPRLFVDWNAKNTIILNQNYRSTPQILRAANEIIANNKRRIPKNLFSNLDNGQLPEHIHCTSQTEEAEKIVGIIKEGATGGEDLRNYAILYRASHLSAEMERALVKARIPYTVWGGTRFFDRKEIKDAIAYLRLIYNPADNLAFERIANVPSRKFGKVSLNRLREKAQADGAFLYDTLVKHLEEKSFGTAAMREFVALIEEARLRSNVVNVADLTDYVLKRTGYTDMLRHDEAEERLENLTELIHSMNTHYAQTDDDDQADTQLGIYLHDVSLAMREDEEDKRKGPAVRMMTIHQAKGLEFPTVFVMGLSEGIFPSHRTIRERREAGEEEERRLMYVAVTRAKQRLYLTESEGYLNENGALKFPSRFLTEIPEEAIHRNGPIGENIFEGTRRTVETLSEQVYGTSRAGQSSAFSIGQKVMHRVFGQGTVEAHNAEDDSYKVRFDDGSSRNLLPRVLTAMN